MVQRKSNSEGSLLALVLRSSITRKQASIGVALLCAMAMVSMIAGAPFGILSRLTVLGASLQLTVANTFFAGLLLLIFAARLRSVEAPGQELNPGLLLRALSGPSHAFPSLRPSYR